MNFEEKNDTILVNFVFRCGGKQSCSFEVNSQVFGDPCPTTFKYMEVHYSCQQQFTTTTEGHAQPPWLLDLSATPSPRRRPTTSTTTTTTTTTSTTTTSTTTTERITESVKSSEQDERTRQEYERREMQEKKDRLYVLESVVDHCPPVTVRQLFWNWTSAGELAIQPCPSGSTGFAKWRCSADSGWFTGSPDLSECESGWLTRLNAQLREGDDVLELADELSQTSKVKTMYGGDVARVSELMQNLAHRMRQQLFSISDPEEKERITGLLSQLLLQTGSNLLEDSQMLAWSDLVPSERAKAGSELVLALQENAFLQANSINIEKDIYTVENNIVSSTRVMRARDLEDQKFKSTDAKVEITIPSEALIENSENGAIRLLFFYYNNMDHILPSSTNGIKFLNSQVASASLSKGHTSSLSKPLTVLFKHTEVGSMTNPTCVWWDFVSKTWSNRGCWSLDSNTTHTTCQCTHLANLAVLMEETTFAAPHSKDKSTSAMTVIIAAVVSVVICLVTVTATFIIFRRFSKTMCGGSSWPCFKTKDERTGYYPYLSSSTTTTTLTPPTPGDQDQSQYCLQNECQVLRPLMITPLGPNSTIYRATFANGQQAHVIPISNQNTVGKNFRPITPSASHIYMEIDPVYNSETLSDILVSDLSDDDLRRTSDDGRQVVNLPVSQYPGVRQQSNHFNDVNCISNPPSYGTERRDFNAGAERIDFNAEHPISSSYTGTGQQLLRLDLGPNTSNIHNLGQFNKFQGAQTHTWQQPRHQGQTFQ